MGMGIETERRGHLIYHPSLSSFTFATMKVLMVCLGNICRSPMAEGILQAKADAAGLGWEVDSAGTANYHVGERPHLLSQKVAKENGVDISKQRGRQLSKADFTEFDKIYVMDKEIYRDAKRIAGDKWDESKVDFLLNELYPNESREVPDPWYGGYENFKEVYEMLDEACEKIIKSSIK